MSLGQDDTEWLGFDNSERKLAELITLPGRRARPRHESRACGTIGSKLGVDATKKLPGESFKRPWPPLIKMDESVKATVEKLFRGLA